MKIVAIAHRSEQHAPEDFARHLDAEAERALELFAGESFREIYSRADGKGAIIVLEAKDEAEAEGLLASLPLAKLGMLRFEIYGTRPYRGFVRKVT